MNKVIVSMVATALLAGPVAVMAMDSEFLEKKREQLQEQQEKSHDQDQGKSSSSERNPDRTVASMAGEGELLTQKALRYWWM
ncbi:hypothetical protein SAMN04487957_101250 [Halomonas shengliensis]|uniref:Uncharacterized protein n=1 Tax=Halomonas shengliensis TaxID=419597 RepID=A0A1H0D3C4_9GAMM|nr:hypothetical protein [Halomonas shengliensis]SDN64589.1 hypothetical protein SAMN04487957_101250 [Halomonas shengliensis]